MQSTDELIRSCASRSKNVQLIIICTVINAM